MSKTIYLLFKQDGDHKNKYLCSVYRGSISCSEDIGDAIEFDSVEQARQFQKYATKLNYNYKVIAVKTVMEELEETEEVEEEE